MNKEQIDEMAKDFCISLEDARYMYEKEGYRKVGCPYCKDRTVTELPLKTNCDTSRVGVLIAQGDKKKEIVFWTREGTYGIEINYCPICGAKMKGAE